MHKWFMFVLFIGACLIGVFGLISEVDKYADAHAVEEEVGNVLKITASNYKFDEAEYKVKAGETFKVKYSNKEGVHAIEIKGLDVKLDKDAKEAEVTFDKPGTYEIHCVLPCGPGHAEMISKLVVE